MTRLALRENTMQLTILLPLCVLLADEEPDFRAHVWVAYALVLVLLGLFTVWTLYKVRGLGRRVDHLRERFEKKHPEESAEGE